VLNEHNTVFASKWVGYLSTNCYFLHSTMPSVMCLRLSDVSVICRVTYFSFQFSLLFFHIGRQTALRHIGFSTQYRTSKVAENVGMYLSCMERTA